MAGIISSDVLTRKTVRIRVSIWLCSSLGCRSIISAPESLRRCDPISIEVTVSKELRFRMLERTNVDFQCTITFA